MAYAEVSDPNEQTTFGDENADLFRTLHRWFRQDSEKLKDWRKAAEEDYGFVAGEEKQWDEKDIEALKDKLRPIVTFNRIDPLIRSVVGEQINNAQEIRFVPREMGDVKPNELLTSAAEWVRDLCDAGDEESEGFWDAAICGVGVTETRIDLEEDPEEPNAVIERVDPLEMLWDHNATKRNLSDARRIWRVKENVPLAEAKEKYQTEDNDIGDADLDAKWARLDALGAVGSDNEGREYENDISGTDGAHDDKSVTIVQCQWWERRTYYRVIDPFTGEMAEFNEEEFRRISGKLKKLGIPLQSVKLRKKVFRQAFLGRRVLKVSDSSCPDRFTFNFITAFRDRNSGTFYGLVRGMKDPQRWANKWLSQVMHIMNTNAKGGVVMERDAVDNVREFEESWAKSDAISWVDNGVLTEGKFQPKPAPTFPMGFYQLMEFAISSIRDTQGINLEMLGMREAGQAASLEYQRRQAGVTILAMLFSSMRRYHVNAGRVLLYFIQNYLSDGRLIRIVGDAGAKYVPLLRQADAKYDIIVDEGPTSPNMKERVWSLIGANFWNLPPQIQLALMEYSPFPSSVVEKVKEAAKAASESPEAKLQQVMARLDAMEKQVGIEKDKAEIEETRADTAKTLSEIGKPTGIDGRIDKGSDPLRIAADLAKAREGNAVSLLKHREGLAAQAERQAAEQAHEVGMAAEQAMLREMFRPPSQMNGAR